MLKNESGIPEVSCAECFFFRQREDSLIEGDRPPQECVALPGNRALVRTSPESFCVLGIQKGTGDRFADIISRHEAHKGIQ